MKPALQFLLLILCFSGGIFGQNPDLKRTQHWYFGHYAGLDFSGGAPVPDTLGAMSVLERSAVISDTSGNLLFYTDGHQVWNRSHQIMQNGDSLGLYFPTPRDASVIIPKPDSDSIYYIFNVDGWENQFQRGIRWHEVDMSLDNGLGAVTSKNNLLYAPVTEQLAATRHANGCDYWVATHERSSDKFLAFRVTADGVDSVPVVSAAGQDYGVTQQIHVNNGGISLRFAPNGNKAVVYVSWGHPSWGIPHQLQLTYFNKITGYFYDAFDLPVDTSTGVGFFSPDGTKLYAEMGYYSGGMYQFDLSLDIDTLVQQSKIMLATYRHGIAQDGQIGSDGKIYTTAESDTSGTILNPHFLSVIDNPNIYGPGCNVQIGTQPLNSGKARAGLPIFVSNFLVDVPSAPCQYTFVYDQNHKEPEKILVYPNPANERLSVSNINSEVGITTVSISDVTGRLWFEERLAIEKNEITLDVSQIPSGLYLLALNMANSPDSFGVFLITIIH